LHEEKVNIKYMRTHVAKNERCGANIFTVVFGESKCFVDSFTFLDYPKKNAIYGTIT